MNDHELDPLLNPRPATQISRIERAMSELHAMMWAGNFEAVEAVVDIGNAAALLLQHILTNHHPSQRIYQAVSIVAENAEKWPVAIPAVSELRAVAISEQLPENLGMARAIKPQPKGRKSRVLCSPGQTRLAFDVHSALESLRIGKPALLYGETWEDQARKLLDFSLQQIDQWATVGAQLIRAQIKRKSLPLVTIPEAMLAAVKKRQEVEKVSFESALKTVSKQWLKAGFRQFLGAP